MVVATVAEGGGCHRSHCHLLCQRRTGLRRLRVMMKILTMGIRPPLLGLLRFPRFDSVTLPPTPIAMVAPVPIPTPRTIPLQIPHLQKTATSTSSTTFPLFAKKLPITFLPYLCTCLSLYLTGNGFAPSLHDSPSSTLDCFLLSIRRTRSASLGRSGKGKHNQDNDSDYPMMEDEEPEYLFPNRTPASTRALARRRAVRSKSVGAASLPLVKRARMERSQSYAFGSLVSFSPGKTVSEPVEMGSAGGSDREDGDEARDEDGDEVDEVMNEEGKDEGEFISISYLTVDLKSSLIAVETTTDPSVADGLRSSEDGGKLITYNELPAIWRNNEHIRTGYRFIPLHLKTGPVPLIKSAFAIHNETVNIHSHLIPTLFIFACIPFIIYNTPLPDAHPLDTAVVIAYLVAAISCLSSSAGWHVLSGCASRKWFEWGACVDYIGISWLIAASFGTVVYNGFYCQPKLTLFYCTTNMLCGALGSYLPFQRWFNERRNKHLRISFFLFLCFAMFAPMVHMFGQYGWHKASAFVAPFMVSIVAYVVGLLFYAFHFPECKWPGKFDIWGSSHQLWHLGIVVAIVLHYRAIFVAHGVKHEYSCAAPGQEISVAMVLERMIGWR